MEKQTAFESIQIFNATIDDLDDPESEYNREMALLYSGLPGIVSQPTDSSPISSGSGSDSPALEGEYAALFQSAEHQERLINFLDRKPYSVAEHKIFGLKRVAAYYTDYLEILEIIYTAPPIPKDLNKRLKVYLNKFQDKINTSLRLLGEAPCNVFEVTSLEYMMSQLELSLHKLTEKQLLSVTEQLLVYSDHATSTVDGCKSRLVCISKGIKGWKSFIESIHSLYLKHNVESSKRTQYLEDIKKAEAGYYQEIFEWLKVWLEGFVAICENQNKEVSGLSFIEQLIRLYKKASQLVEFLLMLKDYFPLEEEQIKAHEDLALAIHKNKTDFREYWLQFFRDNTVQCIPLCESRYGEIQKALDWETDFTKQHEVISKNLLDIYNLIPIHLSGWGNFIKIGELPIDEYEFNQREYAKWQERFISWKIAEFDELSKHTFDNQSQRQGIVLSLEVLANYYYLKYFSILQFLPYMAFVSNELVDKVSAYVDAFQSEVNVYLKKLTRSNTCIYDTASLKKSLDRLLFRDGNSRIVPDDYSIMSRLGFSLYYLTENQLQKAISNLGKYRFSLEREDLVSNRFPNYIAAISDVFDGIKAWDLFIQKLFVLYAGSPLKGKEYHSCLYRPYIETKIKFHQNIIQPAEIAVSQGEAFLKHAQNLYHAAVPDLSYMEQVIQLYGNISRGIQTLKALPEYTSPKHLLDKDCINKFAQRFLHYEDVCSFFLISKTKDLFADFQKHCKMVPKSKKHDPAKLEQVFRLYQELKSIFNMRGILLRLRNNPFSPMREYQKEKDRFQAQILASPTCIEALCYVFQQFDQKADASYSKYEEVKKQFMIRHSINQILADQFYSVETGLMGPNGKLVYQKYQEKFMGLDAQFKAYCEKWHRNLEQIDRFFFTPLMLLLQDKEPTLRKQASINSYQAQLEAFYNTKNWQDYREDYNKFSQLCQNQWGASWNVPNDYAALDSALNIPTPRV